MSYTPPKIEDVGLKTWLTERDYDYDKFIQYADDYLAGIIKSKAVLARKMDVDPRTIDTWLDQLEKEKERKSE